MIISIFIGVVVLQYNMPKPINWTKTYFKKDKIPFGCYAIFHLLENTYCAELETNTETLYGLNHKTTSSNNTFIVVDQEIDMSELDYKNLISFAEKGNTVLMCATSFGDILKDTLHIDTETSNFKGITTAIDSMINKPLFEIKFTQEKNNELKKFVYPIIASESYFSSIDTLQFTVTATNKLNKPILIQKQIGKGKILLCSTPDVFANLFIVNSHNRFFTYTLLSSIKNKTIIWDEYYKSYKIQNKSIFQFIFNSDALYMAYSLLILGLLFFMVFEMKRKQKAIPIIKPLENTTLKFVDVISQVYFNSKNHKYIAEEKIQYFYFEVRKKFGVNTSEINDDFLKTIHTISNIDLKDVKALFSYCENLKHAPSITENDLQELNNRINNFKLKSTR